MPCRPIDIPVPDLTGRRALVTGGSYGIGLALATRLAGAGAEVLLPVRDRRKGEAAVARIRSYGVSNWTPERFDEAQAYAEANGRAGFQALSDHFGLAEAYDVPWAGCVHVTDPASKAWLEERQIPLLPWSSQARGFFTGRARPDDLSDPELVRCYYGDDNFERLRRAEELAAEHGMQAPAIALAYVLAQPFPTFPLFGPRTISEVRSSMRGLSVELTPEQVAWLDLRG